MLAAIPYTTFPELGPIRTFGLFVGIGVLVGAWIAGRYLEERAGIDREESYRMATRLVVAGVIGARLTYVVSHLEDMDSIIDPFAVWEGGLQFSGGFAGAIVFGIPFFRRWDKRQRWIALDGYAFGLSLGLAIGRIGCYSVGEHFGRLSSFPLAVRYDGGSVRESTIGDVPLVEGMTFHQTALYEFLYLLVLFAILGFVVRRGARPATAMAIFCAWYGGLRFLSDFLRVNDETVAGLTGAQYLMAVVALAGIWIWVRVRPSIPGPDEVEVVVPIEDDAGDAAADAEVDDRR